MTAGWRFSTLGDRHRAMGSEHEHWSGMGTAWSDDKDPCEQYLATRTKADFMNSFMVVHGSGEVHEQLTAVAEIRDRAPRALA